MAKTTSPPRGLRDLSEYRELQDRATELHQQHASLLQRIDELESTLAAAPRGAARINAKAMALVSGASDELVDLAEVQNDLAEFRQQAEVLGEATEIQEQVIRDKTREFPVQRQTMCAA